jgi:uncharacterized protein YbjT (DUF2867 family)
MRIVVVGGTGLIGRQLVRALRTGSHHVVSASPRTGVDVTTGRGLADALRDADTVVDVSKPHGYRADTVARFFARSARTLLDAELQAGIRHHITLAAVGTDRLRDSVFYRAKLSQERAVRASGVPFTLVRSTQFFEFAPAIADSATRSRTVRLPEIRVQPIASADVVRQLAAAVSAPPEGELIELAGPTQMPLDVFVRRVLASRGDTRRVVADPTATYFGGHPSVDALLPHPDARVCETTLQEWLERSLGDVTPGRRVLST